MTCWRSAPLPTRTRPTLLAADLGESVTMVITGNDKRVTMVTIRVFRVTIMVTSYLLSR